MLPRLEGAPIGASLPLSDVLAELPFDQQGLVAAIAQQFDTREVLMLAWMNRAAIEETLATGFACYWSRSRQSLWRKGETSGCRQRVVETRFDCDGDAILLLVDQLGGACHTGRPSCFYNAVRGERVEVISAPIQPPIHQK
ncbi:MAG: phosphoribosyl-AMP cyclohydrolase [Dechloromonas sp.]|nr:phosphoribosyl-AMP cyclohydrolase [Dechloromonas sp.]